jgi:hypothetical protein
MILANIRLKTLKILDALISFRSVKDCIDPEKNKF